MLRRAEREAARRRLQGETGTGRTDAPSNVTWRMKLH